MWQVYSFCKMRINVLLILIFCSLKLFAQTPFVNTNPFPQHYFIENKGQFNSIRPDDQAPFIKPLFMYQDNHAQVAILNNGFAINNGSSRFFQKFEYANSDAKIHSEGPSPFYFSYGDQTRNVAINAIGLMREYNATLAKLRTNLDECVSDSLDLSEVICPTDPQSYSQMQDVS